MYIVNHPLCNETLGAPADLKEGDGIEPGTCSILPIFQYRDEDGPWAVSFWKPSQEELDRLNQGGYITLQVRAQGRQHPVVSMGTTVFDPDAKELD